MHRKFMLPLSESVVLLQTTTDIRVPKARQILSRPDSVEVAWWLAKSHFQCRLTCTAYLLPHPSHHSWTEFPAWKLGPNVDWEDERLKAYDSLSPVIRASFCRPIPGSKLENPEDAKNWPNELPKRAEAREGTEKAQVDEALKNFAMLLLEPREVDVVELEPVPNLRTKYVKVDEGWTEESLVP
jgi:pyridoxamine 5'-phosphate oxidase